VRPPAWPRAVPGTLAALRRLAYPVEPAFHLELPSKLPSAAHRGTSGRPREEQKRRSDGGALDRIRTYNLLIRSQMLYPLSYERVFSSL